MADVVTHWGSPYKMMSRILKQQQTICRVLAEDTDKLQSQYILWELSDLLNISSCLDPRFQVHYVVNKDSTVQQIKSEALVPLLMHL